MTIRLMSLCLLAILVTACGPDEIVVDVPSPDKSVHVEVRKCPQAGAFLEWTEKMQVSVLESGRSEPCLSFVHSLVQFDTNAVDEQLQLEWISDTVLRAWHPSFGPDQEPLSQSVRAGSSVRVLFSPKP